MNWKWLLVVLILSLALVLAISYCHTEFCRGRLFEQQYGHSPSFADCEGEYMVWNGCECSQNPPIEWFLALKKDGKKEEGD